MSIRKLFVSLIIGAALFSSQIPLARAHELATDGSIGAELHVDPNDEPVAGESANFFLEFEDKADKFSVDKCQCQATINRDGQQIFSTTLVNSGFSYTFPEKASYRLEVIGQPQQGGAFHVFHLSYDLVVSQSATPVSEPDASGPQAATSPAPPQNHTPHFIIFGLGFVVIGLLYLKDKYKARHS